MCLPLIVLGLLLNECEKDQILLFIVSTNPYIGNVFDLVLSSSKILPWTIPCTLSIFIYSIAVTPDCSHFMPYDISNLVLLTYKKCTTLVASYTYYIV